MSEIDDKIREALADTREGEELFVEQGLMAEAVAPFRGKRRWVNVMGLCYGIAGLALAIWGGVEFFEAENTRSQIMWAVVCLIGILFNAFIKVFFWMEMHSNRILREVKRVELLLVKDRE